VASDIDGSGVIHRNGARDVELVPRPVEPVRPKSGAIVHVSDRGDIPPDAIGNSGHEDIALIIDGDRD
jgi:hypothetical protein